MSGSAKTVGAWAAKAPEGDVLAWYVDGNKGALMIKMAANYHSSWRTLYRRGWRVVRVTITEASK
jgi:hypothetical protein